MCEYGLIGLTDMTYLFKSYDILKMSIYANYNINENISLILEPVIERTYIELNDSSKLNVDNKKLKIGLKFTF